MTTFNIQPSGIVNSVFSALALHLLQALAPANVEYTVLTNPEGLNVVERCMVIIDS
jgi:hypothetical protein